MGVLTSVAHSKDTSWRNGGELIWLMVKPCWLPPRSSVVRALRWQRYKSDLGRGGDDLAGDKQGKKRRSSLMPILATPTANR